MVPNTYGLILRRDKKPLKTKIVATIGSPISYDPDVRNRQNQRMTEPSYFKLVHDFYQEGVDVIRLNLTHIDNIPEVFDEIKQAILQCEKNNAFRKRIAVLADLPGPKIRFDFTSDFIPDTKSNPPQTLVVHLKEKAISTDEVTITIDNKPLKEALDFFDAQSKSFRGSYDQEILMNVFGRIPSLTSANSFQTLAKYIQDHLLPNQPPLLISIGDGDVILQVVEMNMTNTSVVCEVVTSKTSLVRKKPGFTLKGFDFKIPAFTEDDQNRIDQLLSAELKDIHNPVLGFVGLSFAQTAHDVLRLRAHLENRFISDFGMSEKEARLQCPSVIAKIETKLGWKNRDYIIDVADGIMVARGDLGLQMEIEAVPKIQKELVKLCNKRGKPVIIATEMLKSMMQSFEPTRAEGTDVFNAILDGADAVMTSDETSKGKYPFHSISKMVQIAINAEEYFEERNVQKNLQRYQYFLSDDFERIDANTKRFEKIRDALERRRDQIEASKHPSSPELDLLKWKSKLYREKRVKSLKQKTTNRITQAACTLSESDDIVSIVAASTSGRTVRMISRLKPNTIIIGVTHDIANTRKLVLSYGVLPICIGTVLPEEGTEEMFKSCLNEIKQNEFLTELIDGETTVVFIAGTPVEIPGTTNLIQIKELDEKND